MSFIVRLRGTVRFAFILPIRLYQRLVSPLLGRHCRYVPTCSEYAAQAVERYGVLRGILKGTLRIMRCHPFGGSGYDPVDPPVGSTTGLRAKGATAGGALTGPRGMETGEDT